MTTRTTKSRTTPTAEPSPAVTIDDILGWKAPATVEVPICLVPALADARDTTRRAADRARAFADARPELLERARAAKAAEADRDAADAAAEERTVRFVFRALPRPDLGKLLKAHPPTDEQIAEFRAALKAQGKPNANDLPQFDVETFPPALIAAAAVEPPMTPEKAEQLWVEWSDGETQALFLAAWRVNQIIAS